MEMNNETGPEKNQVKSEEINESVGEDVVKNEIKGLENTVRVSHEVPAIKQKSSPEKPKVQNQEEQIEEFDSDEEEELDKSKNENTKPDDSSKHFTYEGNTCIYTEPETGKKTVWIWNAEEKGWRK